LKKTFLFLGALVLLGFSSCAPGLQVSYTVETGNPDAQPQVVAVHKETGDTAHCFVNNPDWGDYFPAGHTYDIFVSADGYVTKRHTIDTTEMTGRPDFLDITVILLPVAVVYADTLDTGLIDHNSIHPPKNETISDSTFIVVKNS
jgi:hypothetical protein